MSFTRGQQSLDYHRVAGVGSVRKARNTVKQRIICDTAASPVSLKAVGGRIHTVWTVSLQGMTPRCSAGTLFLYHAPRGSRNTHAQRGRTVSCRWCVFVYPGLQLSDFASVCSGDEFVLHHRPSHSRAGTLQHRGSVYGPVHPKGALSV